MRRREAPTAADSMPPHLAEFDPDDWPLPGPDWPVDEFPVRSYRRMKWHHARRLWQREQEGL